MNMTILRISITALDGIRVLEDNFFLLQLVILRVHVSFCWWLRENSENEQEHVLKLNLTKDGWEISMFEGGLVRECKGQNIYN